MRNHFSFLKIIGDLWPRFMQPLQALFSMLETPKHIVLVAHVRPDADAMGACLALKMYFERKGHIADVIAPDDFPNFLNWMPGSDKVWYYNKKPKTCFAILSQSNIIICCDFNALKRIEKLGEDIARMQQATLVMIDHHQAPEHFAHFELWDDSASSTCELVFDFIEAAGDSEMVDDIIGSVIYAGIAMDTGIFQYSNTTPKVHLLAARLMEKGIAIETIHNNLYNQFKENRLRFIGYLLSQKMEVLPEVRTAFMCITMKEAEEYKLGTGDKEGIVNLPLSLKQVDLAVLFTEDKDKIKISFRSKGNVNVDSFAKMYFNGGGHVNASGGSSVLPLQDAINYLKQVLPEFMHNN